MSDSLGPTGCSTAALPDELSLAVHFLPIFLLLSLYSLEKKKKTLKHVE